jgi:hypothetical protein
MMHKQLDFMMQFLFVFAAFILDNTSNVLARLGDKMTQLKRPE